MFLIFTIVIFLLSAFKLINCYLYWWKRGVKIVGLPVPLIGNLWENLINGKHYGEVLTKWMNKYENEKFMGVYAFTKPYLLIIDPNLLKYIFTNDFHHFMDRGFPDNSKVDPLSFNIVTCDADNWKVMRENLQLIMNPNKIRPFIPMWKQSSGNIINSIKELIDSNQPVLIDRELSKGLLEIFVTTCLGVTYESFLANDTLKEILHELMYPTSIQNVRSFLTQACPSLLRALRWGRLSEKKIQYLNDFYRNLLSVRWSNSQHDHSDLFMSMAAVHHSEAMREKYKDTHMLLVNNCQVLFSAGIDSNRTLLSVMFFELAKNPNVQEKLFQEVKGSIRENDGEITSDSLSELEYLNAVIKESLRMYPSVPFTLRRCRGKYRIPDSEVILEDGDTVVLPIEVLHRHPLYFPQPERFEPERFLESSLNSNVYIPFGKGPRNCLGYHFSIIQLRLITALLISKFEFGFGEKTPETLSFHHHVFFRKLKESIPLYVKIRD